MNQLCRILLLFGLVGAPALAQNQAAVDSLKRELRKNISDSARSVVCKFLGWEHHVQDKKAAFRYARQSFAFARKAGYTVGMGNAYLLAGQTHNYHHQYALALEENEKALPYFRKANRQDLIALVHFSNGSIYMAFEASEKAIGSFLKAIESYEKVAVAKRDAVDWSYLAQCHVAIADSYRALKQYEKAKRYYRQAIRIIGGRKDYTTQAIALSDFANLYTDRFEDSENPADLDTAATLLNQVYQFMEQHKKEIAADYASDIPALYPINRFNLGNVYFQQRKIDKAEPLLLESVRMAQKILQQTTLAEGNIVLGKIYTQRGKFDLAHTHLKQGLAIATAINPKLAADGYAALRDWAAATKDYRQALAYARKHQDLRDSVYDTEKVKIAENLEIKYETAQKELRIGALEQENRFRQKLNYLYIALAGLGLVLSGVVLRMWRLNRKVFFQKEKLLHEANENARLKQELAEKQSALLQEELQMQAVVNQLKEAQWRQEIDYKQRELTTNVLLLEKNNEFLQTVKTNLQKLLPQANGLQTELKKVFKLIENQVSNEHDFEKFIAHFENVHPDFFSRLHASSPVSLTPTDLKFAAYTRMNLSTKEIANLLNVEPKSIQMARYRLKQKFQLPETTDLVNFIHQL